jgi:hypothetical protein
VSGFLISVLLVYVVDLHKAMNSLSQTLRLTADGGQFGALTRTLLHFGYERILCCWALVKLVFKSFRLGRMGSLLLIMCLDNRTWIKISFLHIQWFWSRNLWHRFVIIRLRDRVRLLFIKYPVITRWLIESFRLVRFFWSWRLSL